jgi:hypothetical protein
MPPELVALGTAFLLVFVVELPDKTMVATLILTTRYRGLPVFVGVSAAFAVQCVIAVAFGALLTLLPDRVVAAVVRGGPRGLAGPDRGGRHRGAARQQDPRPVAAPDHPARRRVRVRRVRPARPLASC